MEIGEGAETRYFIKNVHFQYELKGVIGIYIS